ncbi:MULTISPECIES: hypothetical protein [unclassified Pseudoclavibacter]|uniref:hypothetical protein n=1 Tax=unclassified Pseudoclavibacter TaxID=2615177 RepID=UPI001357C46F|nr:MULTISPECIES: hypothetical protein [unclassified Pseudoclavibacter]MBF4460506.1 hypothetical protein [Pseudoclavibacter sp. VKM Ac-2867]
MAKQLDVGIVLHAIFIAGARSAVEAGRVRVIAAKRETLELLQSTPPRAQLTTSMATQKHVPEPEGDFWSRVKRAFLG